MSSLREWVEMAAQGIEALAVVITFAYILIGTVRWLLQSRQGIETAFARYRGILAKSLLIGLELLVATVIIRTIVLDTTLANIEALAALPWLDIDARNQRTLAVAGRGARRRWRSRGSHGAVASRIAVNSHLLFDVRVNHETT